MFIGYLVENSLWFLLSILLFFGNRLIFSLLLFYFLGCCRRNLILRNLFSRRFNEIKMAVCNLSIYRIITPFRNNHLKSLLLIGEIEEAEKYPSPISPSSCSVSATIVPAGTVSATTISSRPKPSAVPLSGRRQQRATW